MATFEARGTVLGIRTDPYDFEDAEGKRVKGESHTLLVFDQFNKRAVEYKIDRKNLGKFAELIEGETVGLLVQVFAQNARGGGAVLSISVSDAWPIDADGVRIPDAA